MEDYATGLEIQCRETYGKTTWTARANLILNIPQKDRQKECDAFRERHVTREKIHDGRAGELAPPNLPNFGRQRESEVEVQQCC